jgi:hypothetical protein
MVSLFSGWDVTDIIQVNSVIDSFTVHLSESQRAGCGWLEGTAGRGTCGLSS